MANEMNGMNPGVDAIRDAKSQVGSVIDEAAEMANDLFERAETWIAGDSGRTAGLVALVAAAGILGYLIGRKGFGETGQIEAPRSLHS